MNSITGFLLSCLLLFTGIAPAEWLMSNDPAFDPAVQNPTYPESTGPRILLDGAHHNFFVQWDFIEPFASLGHGRERPSLATIFITVRSHNPH